ncbi:MAG TPA: metallophosphoesterase, partial [Vicinamibacterales bacterium]|nr:metallophosphoesterase [Vicinamibacterales bacterium]
MPTTSKAGFFEAVLFALALQFAAWPAGAQDPAVWKDVPRVVVIGDVHGAYAPLVELLQAIGMIGPDLAWSGGDAHLVSVGDLLDRGPDARKVLDLVMRLQREAVAVGGRVHMVLGNHELMNLLGDLRYVTAGDYAAYAAEETPAVRAAAFAALAATVAEGDSPPTQEAFDNAYPPGYFARQADFAASGRYGSWLLSLPAILVINDTAFVHGGLPAVVGEVALDINGRVRADLNRYLTLRDRLVAQG